LHPASRCRRTSGPALVDPLTQLFARLEEWHRLLVHRHRLAGTRIAAGARIAALDGEGAKATQFYPLTTRQGAGDLIEDGCHDQLDIGAPQMRIADGKFRDELRFGHSPGTR